MMAASSRRPIRRACSSAREVERGRDQNGDGEERRPVIRRLDARLTDAYMRVARIADIARAGGPSDDTGYAAAPRVSRAAAAARPSRVVAHDVRRRWRTRTIERRAGNPDRGVP